MESESRDPPTPIVFGDSIVVTCGCGMKRSVKAQFAGKKIKCPGCQRVLVVPRADSVTRSQSESVAVHSSTAQTVDGAPPRSKDYSCLLAPAQAEDEIGRLGPYRVLKVLGAGGMGVVFKAEDPGLQRFVALKAMLPSAAESDSARERFVREARSAAALKHDHIVNIFQVGEDRDLPYLAMEFLEGESLDDCLKREGRLPWREAVRIGREIADGLGAAHERGLIHRDIKPANVWMESRPIRRRDGDVEADKPPARAKILDFGLARGTGESHITHSGMIIGTPAYMPPEQARGEAVDVRCDLYSLGVVLYKMITDDVPFKGANTLALLAALAIDTAVEPKAIVSDVPPRLNDLIMSLLAKNAEERPASAHEVFVELGDLDESPDGPAKLRTDRRTANATPTRRWPLFAIGGGLALLAALFAVVQLRHTPQGGIQFEPPKSPSAEIPPPVKPGEKMTNSIGMKLVLIPPGTFMMGSPESEKQRKPEEIQHEVTITKEFWIGKCEVSQTEYQRVMGSNPSSWRGPNLPVDSVSWNDAKEFCRRLSALEGREYTLPTEAEWEYACRAGTKGPFSTGDNATTLQVNYNGDRPYADNPKGLNRGMPTVVGNFEPNGFGLHDMHGNVWELCEDWKGPYEAKDAVDPKGPPTGTLRIHRGASWSNVAWLARSAFRGGNEPDHRNAALGFRVVLRSLEKNDPLPPAKPMPVPPAVKAGSKLKNSIGMTMMAIPPGMFLMGSPESETERDPKMEAQHEVKIARGFWMGEYEVTQEEYEKVMGINPSEFKGPKLPVEMVTWADAKEFCRRLSIREGRNYTLPREAEWEYACRAGTKGPFSTGGNLTTDQANFNGQSPAPGNPAGLFRGSTIEVGRFASNAFGLHDMHGNVWEWCEDWEAPYATEAATDPKGPPDGTKRVRRGGCFGDNAWRCRSARRSGTVPERQVNFTGFRVVLRAPANQ